MGSRDAVVLSGELSELLRRPVSPVDFWQNPTINALATRWSIPMSEPADGRARCHGRLAERADRRHRAGLPAAGRHPRTRRAVGVPVRGPLSGGKVPDERWQAFDDGSPEAAAALARTTRWGSFLSDVDAFDAEFFEYHAAGSGPHRSPAAAVAGGRRSRRWSMPASRPIRSSARRPGFSPVRA